LTLLSTSAPPRSEGNGIGELEEVACDLRRDLDLMQVNDPAHFGGAHLDNAGSRHRNLAEFGFVRRALHEIVS
jgi:hypothetical protein